MARLQIFISSPGDVIPERRRAALVIEKLAKEYHRFFDIRPYLWEYEPMLASGTFQDVIEPPSASDIMLLILWSRLGTPLPGKTAVREYRGLDGRTGVTGTEWEFEDALNSNQSKGAPDLLVYRKTIDPVVSLKDQAAKEAAETQWSMLAAFWQHYFVDQGEFRAAFTDFTALDHFEKKLETDLRRLIERRLENERGAAQGGSRRVWPGNPFRGLEAYRFEDSKVYFGRANETQTAVERLLADSHGGLPFLLILGPSGSGKSSLAQAGVLPALFTRGVAPGIGVWRRALMRPQGHEQGPFEALAAALTRDEALPELLSSGEDAAALARHLEAAAADPAFPVTAELRRIEGNARASGDLLSHEEVWLVLVVDQLEELFTDNAIALQTRSKFIGCLEGLSRSGRVAVVATMRSDYWHRAADTPALVRLGERRLDLLPATQSQIAEAIRRPAQVAGLIFEQDPRSGIGLDAALAEEAASEPGALPLLSFLLDALYRADIVGKQSSTLTYETSRALGGLKGAIAQRAEEVMSQQNLEVQAALPRMLRALVTVSGVGAQPTAIIASFSDFVEGSDERKLVDALLSPSARLLIGDGNGDDARIRLAHEALITHWRTAAHQIAMDSVDLELRSRLQVSRRLWLESAPRDRSRRLLSGFPLQEATALLRRWPHDLTGIKEYVTASARSAVRSARWFQGVSALLIVLLFTAICWVQLSGYDELKAALFESLDKQLLSDLETLLAATDVPDLDALVRGKSQVEPSVMSVTNDTRYFTAFSGWYWQVSGATEKSPIATLRSRSLWDQALDIPASPLENGIRKGYTVGPEQQELRFIEREVSLMDFYLPKDQEKIRSEVGILPTYRFSVAGDVFATSEGVSRFGDKNWFVIVGTFWLSLSLLVGAYVLGNRLFPSYREKSIEEMGVRL